MSLIRVVSYNIHKGRSFGGRDALADLRLGLHGLRPDVLFLQEVQGRNDQHVALHAQHESLAAALHMEVAYGCNAVRNRTDHGNALLSRYPILSAENEDISDHRLEQRGLLHGVIDKAGREIHCFVVHLGLLARGRERQVSQIMDRINRTVPEDAPVLIAGTRALSASFVGGGPDGLRWLSILAVFAAVYTVLGIALYGPLEESS